ncbi:unnamed protein product [Clonostachys rosea f. rosea IK726]|uniref:Uncharacterized protein n=1 Tax=Clonostachys rosea f. rosea IK726 TaxID=1349383 RepID=A0ACA9T634_BIOOC|nr:unnamed protein product [Clonostachys rosea f. rosea IK726]
MNAAESELWSFLEFHQSDYHNTWDLDVPPHFIPPAKRHPRPIMAGTDHYYQCQLRGEKFFKMLQESYNSNPARLQVACCRVKHLCTVVNPEGPLCGIILSFFQNLETLELHGTDPKADFEEIPEHHITWPSLPRLRFARLFGHIPRNIVKWIMKSSSTLERLEIGLLDRPICSGEDGWGRYDPLPEEEIGKMWNGTPDYGSLHEGVLIPRPMGGFLPDDVELDLPKLKHVFLCSPARDPRNHGDSDPEDGDVEEEEFYDEYVMQYSWSTRAEEATFAAWRRLLLGCRESLEVLVLDQRTGAEYTESDALGREDYVKLNRAGHVNHALVALVQDLITDKNLFPALKLVYLYGFAVGVRPETRPDAKVPGGRLMLALRERGVQCEARLGGWCYFDYARGSANWAAWGYSSRDPAHDGDQEEDNFNTHVNIQLLPHYRFYLFIICDVPGFKHTFDVSLTTTLFHPTPAEEE